MQVFVQLFGKIPLPYFDTQLAAAFLGYGEQISYDKLVEQLLQITLDKSSQHSDWALRPLSDKQLHYAADDVLYLYQLYEKLITALQQDNRMQWVQPLLDDLSKIELYQPNIENSWQRLRIKSNHPAVRGRSKALATWREQQAIAQNIPRSRVLSDEDLLKYAAQPKRAPDSYKETLKQYTPFPPPPQPHAPRHAAALPLLRLLLNDCCKKTKIAEKYVATSSDLIALARDGKNADIAALNGWRFNIFGQAAINLLNGDITIGYDNKTCQISLESQS